MEKFFRFGCVVAISLSLFACAVGKQSEESDDWSFSELEGTPGILGDADFVWLGSPEVPSSVTRLGRTIGVFFVRPETPNQSVEHGVGTLVTKHDGTLALATAKHLVQDPDSGNLKGSQAVFVRPGREPIEIDLTMLGLPRSGFRRTEDFILIDIPIIDQSNIPVVNIAAQGYFSVSELSSTELFAITLVRIQSKFRYGLQERVELFRSDYMEFPEMGTDLDMIKGMSGTPVFLQDESKTILVGIGVGATKLPTCKRATRSFFCQNSVVLLDTAR